MKSGIQVLSKKYDPKNIASESLGTLVLMSHSKRFSFSKPMVEPGTAHFKNHPSLCTCKFESNFQVMLLQAVSEKEEVSCVST